MSFHSEDSNTSYSNQFNIFINDKETGRQYKSKKQMIFKLENNDNLLEGQSDKEKILKELLIHRPGTGSVQAPGHPRRI